MMNFERGYTNLVSTILKTGEFRETRNSPTIATFGQVLKVHELRDGVFPILQGRKMYYKGVLGELKTFLEGPADDGKFTIEQFENNDCNYWDQWASYDKLNIDYGRTWLDFEGVDQLAAVIKSIKDDPMGRRHIISGWHPEHVIDGDLSLPCCHLLYQWYVTNDGYLDMIWYQRSVDTMVGLPSDIILAAAWNIIMANATGLKPGSLTFMLGDTHIYQSHLPGVVKYLQQANDLGFAQPYPKWSWQNSTDFSATSIAIKGYDDNYQNPIKFQVNT